MTALEVNKELDVPVELYAIQCAFLNTTQTKQYYLQNIHFSYLWYIKQLILSGYKTFS